MGVRFCGFLKKQYLLLNNFFVGELFNDFLSRLFSRFKEGRSSCKPRIPKFILESFLTYSYANPLLKEIMRPIRQSNTNFPSMQIARHNLSHSNS